MPGCCCLVWQLATCSLLLHHRAPMASGVCMLVLTSVGVPVAEYFLVSICQCLVGLPAKFLCFRKGCVAGEAPFHNNSEQQ